MPTCSETQTHLRRTENGVIYLTLTSDGATGPEWISRFKKRGHELPYPVEDVLGSKDVKSTDRGAIEIAIIRCSFLPDELRFPTNFEVMAHSLGLQKPNADLVCIIRNSLTNKNLLRMNLRWIEAMHNPVTDRDGDLVRLFVGYGQHLNVDHRLNVKLSPSGGLAYVAPKL